MREDPEGIEMKEVEKHVSLRGKDVLEIGCGNGRLTFQYAKSAKTVMAIDPSARVIAEARKHSQRNPAHTVRFRVGRGERLSFPSESFDQVLLTWSLCCMDIPAMGKALDEAWRVLRQKGTLVNIQPSLHQPFHRGVISYLIERNSGPTIQDDAQRHARLALRHASLVERKFHFIAEEEFPVYTYCDTVQETLEQVIGEYGEAYRRLEKGTKQQIREIIGAMRTKKGVRTQENAVLTILQKAAAPPSD